MIKGEQVIKIRLHGGEGLGGEDKFISDLNSELSARKRPGEKPCRGRAQLPV